MPVYNVEHCLQNTVNSVLAQTYEHWELILVDDRGPDNSGALCDTIAAADARVKVIHKEQNEGVGYARNTGLAAADGAYVFYMDSDDWIEPHTLQTVAAYLEENPVSILTFCLSLDYLDENGTVTKMDPVLYEQPFLAQTPQEIALAAIDMDRQRNFGYPVTKIFSRALLTDNHLSFQKEPIMEDFLFNIQAFSKADSVRGVQDVLYHYIKPTHTTLASSYSPHFFAYCIKRYDAAYNLLKQAGITDDTPYQITRNIFMKHVLSTMVRDKRDAVAMPYSKRYAHAREILHDAHTVAILRDSHASTPAMKVLQCVFRNKMAWISLIMADMYVWISRRRHH